MSDPAAQPGTAGPRYDFGGKVALVTGAGAGIGRATALRFAAAGAAVVIGDVDDAGATVAAEITGAGGRAIFRHIDVRDADACEALVQAAQAEFGGLDLAFNNAGIIGSPAPAGDIADVAWDAALAINLTGVFNCLRAEVAAMRGRGGAIVNNASVIGLRGTPQFAAYSASKHGVIGLTRTAALDYGRAGIRVNAICPGFVRTAMTATRDDAAAKGIDLSVRRTALRRLGEADEIAEAVLWLCSDGASFVTGTTIVVDGGFTAQ